MIRTAFAACGSLAVVILVIAAGACGGGGGQDSSGEDEQKKAQLLATDAFELEPGLAIVEMGHQGGGDFGVNLLSARREETIPMPIEFSGDQNGGNDAEAAFVLAEETGSVNVSRALNIPSGGEHVFEVKADGPWTIEVEQPRPSSAPRTTSFSGDGDTATPFFRLASGPKQVTTTNPLGENLEISLLDRDGNTVEPALVNETDQTGEDPSTDVSTTVDVEEDGIYLFNVQTDGLWTIDISDVEEPSSTERNANIPAGSDILLVLLINLAWFVILAVAVWSRGPEQKRST